MCSTSCPAEFQTFSNSAGSMNRYIPGSLSDQFRCSFTFDLWFVQDIDICFEEYSQHQDCIENINSIWEHIE